MLDSESKSIENKVLEIYRKENPSTYYIEKDKKIYEKIKKYSNSLYIHSLKLLPKVFKDAELLEFGSGTGERSMCFLRWGAKCTFVEMNINSIKKSSVSLQ